MKIHYSFALVKMAKTTTKDNTHQEVGEPHRRAEVVENVSEAVAKLFLLREDVISHLVKPDANVFH